MSIFHPKGTEPDGCLREEVPDVARIYWDETGDEYGWHLDFLNTVTENYSEFCARFATQDEALAAVEASAKECGYPYPIDVKIKDYVISEDQELEP